MLRWLISVVVIAMLLLIGAYNLAGRGAPPLLTIDKPSSVIGQTGTLEVTAEAPNARLQGEESDPRTLRTLRTCRTQRGMVGSALD